MVLLFERNDITKMECDAIVNAANNTLLGGGGVDGAIHMAAGPELLEECRTLNGCETGKAKITKGYKLPAKYVIHTVGPIYRDGKHNEKELLTSCYKSCLELAKENKIHSIAFPLISAGIFGYPKDEALDVAINTIKNFFKDDDYEITVKIVFYGQAAYAIGIEKIGQIDEYIDDNYAKEHLLSRKLNNVGRLEPCFKSAKKPPCQKACVKKETGTPKSGALKKAIVLEDKEIAACSNVSLDDMIKGLDASFSDTLLKIIDKKKLKDSDVYFRANMDRKLFSKIRNGSHPKKTTAVSLCIALKLSYKEANDLLIKAGYILNNSEKFDVIISYFLKKKKYDIYEINEALLHYDQPQLGAV